MRREERVCGSRIRVVDVAEEIHDYSEHWFTKTHVVIDIAAKEQQLLLQLHLVHVGKGVLFCLSHLPPLPTLVEIVAEERRGLGFVGWQR